MISTSDPKGRDGFLLNRHPMCPAMVCSAHRTLLLTRWVTGFYHSKLQQNKKIKQNRKEKNITNINQYTVNVHNMFKCPYMMQICSRSYSPSKYNAKTLIPNVQNTKQSFLFICCIYISTSNPNVG